MADVYSNLPIGNYHRYLFQGNYNVTFSNLLNMFKFENIKKYNIKIEKRFNF